ncbi:hypothetical protein GTA08_BOTSDO09910 [Neofusicoccum parvum]|nr:hypothetical protein GTA08_BOTSDO09910 [Neofusicoccum parvum]
MADDGRSGAGIALLGAPDKYIGEKQVPSGSRGQPAMLVEITQDVVDGMLTSVRNGRPPVVIFGQNPILKYGETKIVLDASKERFRNELYATADPSTPEDTSDAELHFKGSVDHRLALQQADQAMSGADAALQTLKSNMEAIRKEKTAAKSAPQIIDQNEVLRLTSASNRVSMDIDPLRLNELDRQKRYLGKKGTASQGNVLGRRMLAQNSSNASSPSLSAASPKPTAPTSAPSSMSLIQKAIRVPLMHFLAIKSVKVQDIVRKLRAPKEDIMAMLGKVGKELGGGEWKLADKSYKELDVFNFAYPSDEIRQQAIDNAIRALDRQRLDPQDKVWQKFLPEEERGKGKVVSKLSLGAPATTQKSATPTMKPTQRLKSLTKKVAEPKKKEPRKKKVEEDSFGIAARNKIVKPPTDESNAAVSQKKPLKRATGEEKDAPERRKLGRTDEIKERPAQVRVIKRPIDDEKESQVQKKRLKQSVQDDTESASSNGKRKVLKTSNASSKDASAQDLQKTGRVAKGEAARQSAVVAPAKHSKETVKQDLKAGTRPATKKPQQATGTSKSTGLIEGPMGGFKRVLQPERKVTEQKAAGSTGKTTQPKITEKPFTSTKKVSDHRSKTSPSTGSPAAASDVEKQRVPKKSLVSSTSASANTPGNSDRTLKRKANDIDNDIHKHDVTSKQRRTAHSTPVANGTTATPPSTEKTSTKRKAQDLDTNTKPPAAKKLATSYKAPNTTQTPTPSYSGASSISSTTSSHSQHANAAPAHHHDSPQSLHDYSSASPDYLNLPLNVRRAIELSAQFKVYYAKYHTLYTTLAARKTPPEEKERIELCRQETILNGMKKQIQSYMDHPDG